MLLHYIDITQDIELVSIDDCLLAIERSELDNDRGRQLVLTHMGKIGRNDDDDSEDSDNGKV